MKGEKPCRRPTKTALLCERLEKVNSTKTKSHGSNMKPCLDGRKSKQSPRSFLKDSVRGGSDRAHSDPKVPRIFQSSRLQSPVRSVSIASLATMSPKKAARVAMLSDRFAETIKKAEKTLSGSDGEKQFTEKIEEAKGCFEAEMKRREELRRAAREALEEVERSVVIEDNLLAVKEFEKLCRGPITYSNSLRKSSETN